MFLKISILKIGLKRLKTKSENNESYLTQP